MNEPDKFPIIGVGASAGGIEAIEGLLRGLPPQPGLALVIVTHLSPGRESLLPEIVARYTNLVVKTCSDGAEVENNQIYVMPADAVVGIADRRLQVRKNDVPRERKPIDVFLSALAVDVGERAGGIILSGGDGDGTLGVKAIKERGGITFAQVGDGFGPQHSEMPDTAIASGVIDFAIPVDEMGEKLVEFARGDVHLDALIATDGAGDDEKASAALPEIYAILRNQLGHDFSGYKTKTFLRRVQRRMQVTQLTTLERYVERLRRDSQEVAALFRDLLINVTSFFRDNDAFDALAANVIPKLFEGRGADDAVRVWVPGCATGEEVFSLAILMREHMERLTAAPRVQIFATDIDERALVIARAARYPAALLDGVSDERRARHFIPDSGSYVLSKDVRELCIFSPHSVIRDPPFSRIDLISCRNLLIYFAADVQNQIIPTFHYALRPDGYLFLGSSENVSQFGYLFEPIDKHHRIFRRRSDVAPPIRLTTIWRDPHLSELAKQAPRRLPLAGMALRQAVDEQVLERYSPAHVVVNHDGDVVYYSGRTGKYLEAPAGAPTRQLLTMARKGLRLDLRTLFREVVETGRPASRNGLSVEGDGERMELVNVTIEPLGDRPAGDPLFLVLFSDQGPLLGPEETLSRAQASNEGAAVQIERELKETRDRLQATIEEYETALEELKSSNEELVSVNEEMQSTNEELEASKEELQSVNEELHTVNMELSRKVEELNRANSDLQNLFESTDVATIFLDKDLSIRSFTPAVVKIFAIRTTDKGRPITDFSSKLALVGFADDIQKVFSEGVAIERRIETDDHLTHYLVRLAPYRNASAVVEGVVVTFIDVTTLTKSQARQRMLIGELQHRTRNLLAVVQATAQKTLGKGGSLEDFSTRLAALGRVQSFIGGAHDEQVDFGDVVRMEFDAVAGPDGKVSMAGPAVALNFDQVQTLGLAVHELATNAVKHGALKQEGGRIDITWTVRNDSADGSTLVFDWREHGVADVQEPTRKGFGAELIEKALQFTLRAKAELTFHGDGVSCHIELPLPAKNGS